MYDIPTFTMNLWYKYVSDTYGIQYIDRMDLFLLFSDMYDTFQDRGYTFVSLIFTPPMILCLNKVFMLFRAIMLD